MDISDLEIKQRSSKIEQLKEQLQQLEEDQQKTIQRRNKELSILKQKVITDSSIQDLEDMVMRDLSYNIPIEYYEIPYIKDHRGGVRKSNSLVSAIKKTKYTFDIIKEQHVNSLLPSTERKSYDICTIHKNSYTMNGPHGMEQTFDSIPVITTVPNPSIAETSDKFVEILNIVKQQGARIKELEKRLKDEL